MAETDSVYIGRPGSLALDSASGSLYVGDPVEGRVLVVAPNGTIRGAWGKKGPGPHEIAFLHALFLAGRQVVVVDTRASALKLIDPTTYQLTPAAAFQGAPSRAIANAGDTAWIGLRSPLSATAVASWVLGEDSLRHLIALPREYTEYPNLARFTGLPVLHWADTLLIGFGPLNGLLVARASDGRIHDTVYVPRARRRGSSEAVVHAAGGEWAGLMNGISALNAMARLRNGQIALVHFDNNVPSQGAGIGRPHVYLTLLSPRMDSACVDVPVPFDGDVQPLLAFTGDTAVILYQKVVATTSNTWVKRFRIEGDRCSWRMVPTRDRMLAE